MRIALVSPYSWTYPGGVTRHIEALAGQLIDAGHHVRVLAPFDPDDRLAARLHRGARPEPRPAPDYLISLGRTIGLPANGAVSNVCLMPTGLVTMRRALEQGGFDVLHVHEPIVPALAWDACRSTSIPAVGTLHCYSASAFSNNLGNLAGARGTLNRLRVRIAVSEAAAWTGRRFFGGRYRVIPNGVDLSPIAGERPAPADRLRIVFVGQAVERKGLPTLLRAFEALREHIPAELTIVGADQDEVAPMVMDATGVRALGKVSDDEKRRALREADVLCAPSLGGESFGMVLTEAFACGTPVIASDIPGYRDVVRDGREGVLVPRGDARALAEALRDLWHEPARRASMAAAAAERAERFGWPRVTAEVVEAYEDAVAMPVPEGRGQRAAVAVGARAADGSRERPRRLPSLEHDGRAIRRSLNPLARRIALIFVAVAAAGLALLALQRIGIPRIAHSLLAATPTWVLVGLALMCASMGLRAIAWLAILRAALPGARVRAGDALQGTFIGVLMSATLPARLGEPSRALVVARRLGHMRERFPVVLGTIVSQTLLNIVALAILGGVMFSTVGLFHGHQGALVAATIVPIVLLAVVLLAPALLRRGPTSRSARLGNAVAQVRRATSLVRSGLVVFRRPRLGAVAVLAQLSAWGLQWMSCYALLVAFDLDHRAGVGAAAAVLFAVNVTAVLPVVPSNLGVFQAACVAVLTGAYGISSADALGYGIVLQAVEIATAAIMGMPALLKEGLSWRDVRLRALHAAPVQLPARPGRGRPDTVEV